MKTIFEIDKEISELKEELKDVHGTETEVYTRIVGYYRAVKNWNKGKKEEYKNRKVFDTPTENTINKLSDIKTKEEPKEETEMTIPTDLKKSYIFFHQKICPKCKAVEETLLKWKEKGVFGKWVCFDPDDDASVLLAEMYTIISSPTVVFISPNKTELGRANTSKEIDEIISNILSVDM